MQSPPGGLPPTAPPPKPPMPPPGPPGPPQGGAGAPGGIPPQWVHLLQQLGGKFQGFMGTAAQQGGQLGRAMDEKIGQGESAAGQAILHALGKLLSAGGTGADKSVSSDPSPYSPVIKALSGQPQTPGTPLSDK